MIFTAVEPPTAFRVNSALKRSCRGVVPLELRSLASSDLSVVSSTWSPFAIVGIYRSLAIRRCYAGLIDSKGIQVKRPFQGPRASKCDGRRSRSTLHICACRAVHEPSGLWTHRRRIGVLCFKCNLRKSRLAIGSRTSFGLAHDRGRKAPTPGRRVNRPRP